MASSSETGHAKNVANFEDLISFCQGYGGSYNPSKPSIQIPNLQSLRTTAQGTITTLTNVNTVFINATNARQAVFNPLKPLATRIVNALDATEASDRLVEDARTINRKIQGSRSGKLTKADAGIAESEPTETAKNISVSQQSYDSLIENFKKLIELVASEPSYAPNEPELQVTTLTAQAADLEAKNTAVIDTTTNLSNARIARNNSLYSKDTGLVDIAGEVKKYVKSVFGATSPQYKQVIDTYKNHVKYDRQNNERTILHDFFNQHRTILLRDTYSDMEYELNLNELKARNSEECDFILKTEYPEFLNTTFFEVKKEDVTFYVKKDTKRPQISAPFFSHLQQIYGYKEYTENPNHKVELDTKLYPTKNFDFVLLAGRLEEKEEMKDLFEPHVNRMFEGVKVITYEELEEVNTNYLDKFNRLMT